MDSNYTRAHQVFMTFIWVLIGVATLNHATSYLLARNPTGSIALTAVKDLTENRSLRADQANLAFTWSADFSSEFNWNSNQLFVYIVAEYETEKKQRNQVTIYDTIIKSADEAVINQTVTNEYPLRDQFKGQLFGTQVKLVVHYMRMPLYGFMEKKILCESEAFTLPDEYKRAEVKKKGK